MSFGDVLIVLAVLVIVTQITLFIRDRWGSLKGVAVQIGNPTPARTRGEVDRQLWEQKSALDRAKAAAAAPVAQPQASTAIPATWHAPDAPCEVEQ